MFESQNILRIFEIYEQAQYLFIVYQMHHYIELKFKADELSKMDETS